MKFLIYHIFAHSFLVLNFYHMYLVFVCTCVHVCTSFRRRQWRQEMTKGPGEGIDLAANSKIFSY